MSYPVVSNVQYRLTEANGETLIKFKHAAFGLLQDEHRTRRFGWLEPHQRPYQDNSGGPVMNHSQIEHPKVVSQEEWLAARKELLVKEKALSKLRDALSEDRRNMPWVKVKKEYVFDTPEGKKPLADLFGGKSQLIVYHFMLGPGWAEGCPSCSFLGDHFDGSVVHLAHRDATLLAVSRAPLAEIQAFKQRMGWRFKWVSSFGSDFNFDYHVSFTKGRTRQGQGLLQLRYDQIPE